MEKNFVLWREGRSKPPSADLNLTHCEHPEIYHFTYSRQFEYNASGCRSLPAGDRFAKDSRNLYFPTYVTDRHDWYSSGDQCNEQAEFACQSLQGGVYESYTDDAGNLTCHCTAEEEYFVKDIDHDYIVFLHGFEVQTDPSTHFYSDVRNSVSSLQLDGNAGAILTLLVSSSGKPCYASGKSVWTTADSMQGIKGTIDEWLMCTGKTLDMRAIEDGATRTGSDLPYLRVSGLVLYFTLSYFNKGSYSEGEVPLQYHDFDGTVCVVKVHADPTWNSRTFMAHVDMPTPFRLLQTTAYRYRYTHGITVVLRAGGSFSYFNLTLLISAIVNVMVLLEIPSKLIQFIATRTLGLLSQVYRGAQRERLDVRKSFPGISARMMAAGAAFRALTSQIGVPTSKLQGIGQVQIKQALRDVFHEKISQKVLDDFELSRLASSIFEGLDLGESGTISYGDFINSCSNIERIDLDVMSKFFDLDRKRSMLERLFDQTRWYNDNHVKPLKSGASTESIAIETKVPVETATGEPSEQVPAIAEGAQLAPDIEARLNEGKDVQAASKAMELVPALQWRCSDLEKQVQSLEEHLHSVPTSLGKIDSRMQLVEDQMKALCTLVSEKLKCMQDNASSVMDPEKESLEMKVDLAQDMLPHPYRIGSQSRDAYGKVQHVAKAPHDLADELPRLPPSSIPVIKKGKLTDHCALQKDLQAIDERCSRSEAALETISQTLNTQLRDLQVRFKDQVKLLLAGVDARLEKLERNFRSYESKSRFDAVGDGTRALISRDGALDTRPATSDSSKRESARDQPQERQNKASDANTRFGAWAVCATPRRDACA